MKTESAPEAPLNCPLCPRLVEFRHANQKAHPDWFNAPVPSFGPENARLLVLGLAPGLQGANRTGRPFTGDWAGDLLYPTLLTFGFAKGEYKSSPDDGLQLVDCMISNAVRCVPPQNKPTGPEATACRPYLKARLDALPKLTTVIALGRVAHENLISVLGLKRGDFTFAHAAQHQLSEQITLFDSYHCSRYNTNTGRLTEAMFHDVFRAARAHINS